MMRESRTLPGCGELASRFCVLVRLGAEGGDSSSGRWFEGSWLINC